MRRLFSPLILGALLAPFVLNAADFQPLYNGKDLSGWHQVTGKAPFQATPEGIVGATIADSPNSFLATEKEYSDFELEYDLFMEKGKAFNSGVQFRSALRDDKGEPRVYGYQCEVDPSERGWSGGVYDEAARLWLYPVSLNPDALRLFKEGEWNHFKIQACGKDVRTWLNGHPVAHVIDAERPRGFIALQVHAIYRGAPEGGHKVTWKNLRLREIKENELTPIDVPYVRNLIPNTISEEEKKLGWSLLWNGRDAEGWRSAKGSEFPKGGWEMKDGLLTVLEAGGSESTNGGDIVTKKEYSEFELQLDFRITEGANSGIKYFVQTDLNKGQGSAIGLEYQILDDVRHPDAKLGRDGNRTVASLYDLITASADKPKVNPGEWHHARIVAKGRHVEHWLDGRLVVSYERGTEEFRALVAQSKYKVWANFGEWKSGPILLQDHGNRVSFHSIKIRELK